MRIPYAHQQEIIDDDLKKTGIWMGTGSGKGFIALSLAKGDTLVICPKTIRDARVWEREYRAIAEIEMQKYRKGNNIKTFKPRLQVISKEEFRRDAVFLPRFNTVISDETHTMLGVTPNTRQRNKVIVPKASQLFDAFEAYLLRTKPERLYLLSATIVKSPMTVWAARQVLGKNQANKLTSFLNFRDTFYTRLPMPGRDIYAPKKDAKTKEHLAELVRDCGYVGRLQDFFDVPEQTFRTVYVGLTAAQTARIRALPLQFPDPIVLIGKKNQVENGCLAGDEFSDGEIFPNEKIEKLLELADEFPRMIIFAKWTAQINAIENAFKKAKKPILTMTGKSKDRQSLILEVNKRLNCAFLVQSQISEGWECPDYPVMVFASRTYSLVDYIQAQGRISRANALKKNLYINLVVKDGIDEAVDKCLESKCDFNERVHANV